MDQNWIRIGEGNTAEIFRTPDGKAAKLFKAHYPQSAVRYEYENHQAVCALMDNVPKLVDFIEVDGRYGYIMDEVRGVSLVSFVQAGKMTAEAALDLFVDLHRNWLKGKTQTVISYKDWILHRLKSRPTDAAFTESILALPEGDTLCHGDFHPYNILMTAEGKPVIIDFANICRAPAAYDVARTYVLFKEAMPSVADVYLEKMGMQVADIERYAAVIRAVRKCEMG